MADSTGLGFIDAPLDRAAALRGDANWIDQQIKNPHSKVIVFVDERPAISINDTHLDIYYASPMVVLKFHEQAKFCLIHLNEQGEAVFAVQVSEELREKIAGEETKFIDLRSLAMQAILPPHDLGALAQARSLLSWHSFHKFCANCGSQTSLADGGYRRDCDQCQTQHFPRVDPVVIMLIRHGDKFLLGRGHNFEENRFSALAGFLEPGETIEAATRRETFEETGIKVGEVRYLISQPWPFPSTLMIGVIGQALNIDINPDPEEIAEAQWFSCKEISQMLVNNHPAGTTLPPPMSIAYQMMKKLLDGKFN